MTKLRLLKHFTVLVVMGGSSMATAGDKCSAMFLPENPTLITRADRKTLNRLMDEDAAQLLNWAQKRLASFGFVTKKRNLQKLLGLEEAPVLEIVEFPQTNRVGKFMAKAHERFQLRFLIDPLLQERDNTGGFSDEKFIAFDLNELAGDLQTVPPTLLHEVRHAYLASMLPSRIGPYHGDIVATAKDYRVGRKDFYEKEISIEELTTYFRDVKVEMRAYQDGKISQRVLTDTLKDLRRVSLIIDRQLGSINKKLDRRANKRFYFVDNEPPEGYDFSYAITKGRRGSEKIVGYVILPIEKAEAAAGDLESLKQQFFLRVHALREECQYLAQYANDMLNELKFSR